MKFSLLIICLFPLIEHVISKSVGSQIENHPSCNLILKTWWDSRLTHKVRDLVGEWDNTCKKFNGDRNACIIKGGVDRLVYFNNNKITESERDETPCVMLGVHSDKCVGNPCNHYNSGKCTVQHTGGLCNWYTKKESRKHNVPYGCHRNLCHIGGDGRTPTDECEARGVDGFIKCTWCKSNGGMGCQRVRVKTRAQCAPINTDVVSDNTIWSKIRRKRCQCVDKTIFCKDDLENNGKKFKRRFRDP